MLNTKRTLRNLRTSIDILGSEEQVIKIEDTKPAEIHLHS